MNKNYSEKFEKMSVAGKLAAQTLDMITEYIKPGISTNKIDQLCYEFIKDNNGYSAPLFYRGFKKSLCTSLNHVVCHGIPSDRILDDGWTAVTKDKSLSAQFEHTDGITENGYEIFTKSVKDYLRPPYK